MGSGASVVGSMNIVLGGDGATFSQSIERAQAQLNKLKGMTGDFSKTSRSNFDAAGQSAQRFGHSSVTSVQAASGALRELNGDITNNIRAVERFITTIPGVGGALKAIYPLVGGIAVAGMFYEGIKKAQEFIATVNKVPVALRTGFREITEEAHLSNDQLLLTNDRLQNEINKLAGRPQNNLAISIDETRIASDRLAKSLAESTKRVAELLKQNSIGFLGAVFRKGETVGLAGSVNSFETDRATLAFQQSQAVRGGDTKKAEDLARQLDAKTDAELQYVLKDTETRTGTVQQTVGRNRVTAVPYSQVHGDQSAALEIDRGVAESIYADKDQKVEEARNATLTAQKDKADAAVKAARKSSEDRLRAMQEGIEQLKTQTPITAKYEYDYWVQRLSSFQKGYAQYQEVQAKIASLAAEGARQSSEKVASFKKEQTRRSAEDATERPAANRAIADVQKLLNAETEKYSNSLAELNAVLLENGLRFKEQKIGFDVASGAMSRHDAAVQLSTLHLAQYQVQMDKIDQEARNDAANSSLTPDQRRDNAQARDLQRRTLEGQAQMAYAADQNAVQDTTVLGASVNALQEFAAAATDASAKIKDLVDSSLTSFNDQVIKSLTTRDHQSNLEFRNLGAGIFRGVAGKGLSGLEGMGIKALGLGGLGGKKPTGAAGDPLHTVSDDKAVTAAGSDPWGIINKLFSSSGMTSAAGSAVSSGIGAFAAPAAQGFTDSSAFLDSVPFFGDGGAISAGTMAIVGDRGPELFMPGSSGRIIPNHALGGPSGGMGGEMHFHSHVDARGSTDPAAVQAIVDRSWRINGPKHAALTIAAMDDRNRRVASIRRR